MFKEQGGLKGVQKQKVCSHLKELPQGVVVHDLDLDIEYNPGPVIKNLNVGQKDPDEAANLKRQRIDQGILEEEKNHYDILQNPNKFVLGEAE